MSKTLVDECQENSYHHKLERRQNITITKLTLQNKVEVKTRGRDRDIKQDWWASHHCSSYGMTSADWKLGYINKLHFKVWDERGPPLTFLSITGSSLKKICSQVPVSHFNLWYWHGCENLSLWNWAFHMLNKDLKCTLLWRVEGGETEGEPITSELSFHSCNLSLIN